MFSSRIRIMKILNNGFPERKKKVFLPLRQLRIQFHCVHSCQSLYNRTRLYLMHRTFPHHCVGKLYENHFLMNFCVLTGYQHYFFLQYKQYLLNIVKYAYHIVLYLNIVAQTCFFSSYFASRPDESLFFFFYIETIRFFNESSSLRLRFLVIKENIY